MYTCMYSNVSMYSVYLYIYIYIYIIIYIYIYIYIYILLIYTHTHIHNIAIGHATLAHVYSLRVRKHARSRTTMT